MPLPPAGPFAPDVDMQTRARTHLTTLLTDIELVHRIVDRIPVGGEMSAAEREALLSVTRDALASARSLAEALKGRWRLVPRRP